MDTHQRGIATRACITRIVDIVLGGSMGIVSEHPIFSVFGVNRELISMRSETH